MSRDWQTANRRDDREQINKARDAAEALFRPKQSNNSVQAPVASPDAPTAAEQPGPRQPRVFAIPPANAIAGEQREVVVTTTRKERRTSSTRGAQTIVRSDHGRIRALVHYGMTIEQVAALYAVPAHQVERIIAKT